MSTRRILIAMTGLLAFGLWFLLLRPAFLGGPAAYVMVSGHSMEPTMYTGDLALLRLNESYRTGDIIAFRAEGGLVIHRVIGGTDEEGYITQGDNRDSADPWRPRSEHIVGKMWLHIPGAGTWFALLRQPINFGALMGGIGVFSVLGTETKRRRKRGTHMRADKPKPSGSDLRLPAPPSWLAALGILALLTVLCGWGVFTSFHTPLDQTVSVERLRYEQSATYDYIVRVQKSSLYPSDTIGPVSAGPDGSAVIPPVYTKLARSLDLGYAYLLKSGSPAQMSGELSAVVSVQAGEKAGAGWTKTLPLEPTSMQFDGTSVAARINVNFAEILALIDTVEKETEFKPLAYEVKVIPTVRIKGNLGNEAVEEAFAPPFTMKLDRTQIELESKLVNSDVKSRSDSVANFRSVPPLGLSVVTSRILSTAVTAIFLLVTLFVAAVVFLGIGRGETAKLRARYGSMLIAVTDTDLKDNETNKVQVATMQDLVRLAQRDGGIIFHQEITREIERYFVQEGPVLYEYVRDEAVEDA